MRSVMLVMTMVIEKRGVISSEVEVFKPATHQGQTRLEAAMGALVGSSSNLSPIAEREGGMGGRRTPKTDTEPGT